MDAAHQLVEQHAVCRRRRQHRLLPLELHSEARSEVRLDQAGRRHQPGHRVERRAVVRRVAERGQSAERLGLQHQQLSVLGGRRADSPKQKDFPAYMDSGSENPRGVHAIRVLDGKKGFTLDSLIARRLRQLPAGVRDPDSAAAEGVRRRAGVESAQGQARRADRGARRTGTTAGRRHRCRRRWRCSTARISGSASPPTARKAGVSVYEYMRSKATAQQRLESLAAAIDKLTADFGKWQTPWGDINRFQRNDARDRAEVRRLQAEHAGDVRLGAMGIAGVVRRPRLSRHQEVVRHERQQLRGGGRVWRSGDGQGGDRRRLEQRCRRRSTSTTRPIAMRRATCATSTSIAISSKGHTEREYKPGQ